VTVLPSIFEPPGPSAAEIAGLWWLMLALGTTVFVLVLVLLIRGLYRRRSDDQLAEPEEPRVGRSWLLGGGVILPTVGIVIVFVFTVAGMRNLYQAPLGALTIELVAHQWWWEVRYPDEGINTVNEVHIPAGRPVELRLISADVIHSFWVPALGGKMDALPDRVNTMIAQVDEPGRYHGQCAEFCGLEHARMVIQLVAEEREEFEAWVESLR
jgi:cytochrome c oxidase subunit 2